MILDDNIMMFVSNSRAVFLKKFNHLCVLFPCHDTKEYSDTGMIAVLIHSMPAALMEPYLYSVLLLTRAHGALVKRSALF